MVSKGRVNSNGLKDMDIQDDLLYVVSLNGYLETYDITDPLTPLALSQVSGLEKPLGPRCTRYCFVGC